VRLAARVGAAPAGAVIHAPGLPRLLIVSEGERHITAIDLVSGEVRWRHALGRGRFFKVRRAGRLLVISSSEPTLTALDAATGELVWRIRDRMRFCRPAAYDNNALFVVTGDTNASSRPAQTAVALDAWTGVQHWRADLPNSGRAIGAPLPAHDVALVAINDPRGCGFLALERDSGKLRWQLDAGFAPCSSAWLLIDDRIVVNGAHGRVCAVDVRSGNVCWKRNLGTQNDSDVPRHLDPLLRSGALFIPQQQVHVLRPTDGEPLGAVNCELVPDLVRVDDRCNVLVVEDSGHIASFNAGARLTLVKGGAS